MRKRKALRSRLGMTIYGRRGDAPLRETPRAAGFSTLNGRLAIQQRRPQLNHARDHDSHQKPQGPEAMHGVIGRMNTNLPDIRVSFPSGPRWYVVRTNIR